MSDTQLQSEVKGMVMYGFSENDEWTSNIVTSVQGIVKKALTEERIAIIDLLESALARGNRDNDVIADLIRTIQNRKLNFKGVQI